MELKSFREILLKKADGNLYLQTLIKYAKDDLIAEEVIDSLLKMAEPSAAMGRGANSALTSFAGHMDNSDVEQMRDALGHHISHYKGALKTMHGAQDPAQKTKLRGVADQHLNKIVPLMHMAGRAGKHSGGKMTLDYTSTTPWESNYTTTHRHDHNGKLKEGTKDLGRRPSPNAKRPPHNVTLEEHEKKPQGNIRAVPDYRYLEMQPHGEHPMSEKMPHKGGYPFEEVQLGAPAKRDAGQAYLPIEDVGDVSEYTPHPFDQHPIHQIADEAEHHLTQEQKEKFVQDLGNWKSGEPHKKWLADQKAKYQANPEAYKARGTKKPNHIFDNMPLSEQPAHAKGSATTISKDVIDEKPSIQEPATDVKGSNVLPFKAPVKESKAFDISKPPEGMPPSLVEHWNSLPSKVRQELHEAAARTGKK